MTPLNNWAKLKRGYTFLVPTNYSAHHLGLDLICPVGTEIRAPFDGIATKFYGTQGGATIHFQCKVQGTDYLIRFMHLSQFKNLGKVKSGDVIGLSGNTGVSTQAHVHVDISVGTLQLTNLANFRNPETFNWNPVTYTLKLTVLNKDEAFLNAVNALVKDYSNNSFNLEWKHLAHPIVSTSENLTQDESVAIINSLGIKDFAVLFYEGHGPYSFAKQSVNPVTNMPYVSVDSRASETPFLFSFETAHMAQVFYNTHRGTNPPVNVVDVDIPTEALIRAKFQTVIPYIPYLNSLEAGEKPMTAQEVKMLQALEGYQDAVGVAYWTGKPLAEYLKARLADKIVQIQSLK